MNELNAGWWTGGGRVEIPGGRLAYVEHGEGQPVILLHKLGGWSAEWRRAAAGLPSGIRAIAVDLPGHGESRMAPPSDWFQPVERSAETLGILLDELGLESAHFAGCSMGGSVAAVFAGEAPGRVRSLTLLNAAIEPAHTMDEVRKSNSNLTGVWYGDDDLPLYRDFETFRKMAGSDRQDIFEEQNASRSAAGIWIRRAHRGVGLGDIAARLPKIQAPVLLIYVPGESLTLNDVPIARERLRDMRIVDIPNAGRFPHEEAPEATAEVIANFIQNAHERGR